MEDTDIKEIIEKIYAVRNNAYSPYSEFEVGAAAVFEDGKVYFGVNVENKSYGLTVCAERNAIAAGIAVGNRKLKILIVSADTKEPVMPCGACREVIAEFSDDKTTIIAANLKGMYKKYRINELLPFGFELEKC